MSTSSPNIAAFEHIDERLVEFTSDPAIPQTFVARNIGPKGAFKISGLADDNVFHHFDPQTGVASFWKTDANVRTLADEINRVHQAVRAARETPQH